MPPGREYARQNQWDISRPATLGIAPAQVDPMWVRPVRRSLAHMDLRDLLAPQRESRLLAPIVETVPREGQEPHIPIPGLVVDQRARLWAQSHEHRALAFGHLHVRANLAAHPAVRPAVHR